MPTGRLKTASVYDPASTADGRRVLVTRYWPRGLSRARVAVDERRPELAPSRELLRAYQHESLTWSEFARSYRREMRSPDARAALKQLGERRRGGEAITLLCVCHSDELDEDRIHCHRRLLRQMLPG